MNAKNKQSAEDYDPYTSKMINSPRSVQACKNLNLSVYDLLAYNTKHYKKEYLAYPGKEGITFEQFKKQQIDRVFRKLKHVQLEREKIVEQQNNKSMVKRGAHSLQNTPQPKSKQQRSVYDAGYVTKTEKSETGYTSNQSSYNQFGQTKNNYSTQNSSNDISKFGTTTKSQNGGFRTTNNFGASDQKVYHQIQSATSLKNLNDIIDQRIEQSRNSGPAITYAQFQQMKLAELRQKNQSKDKKSKMQQRQVAKEQYMKEKQFIQKHQQIDDRLYERDLSKTQYWSKRKTVKDSFEQKSRHLKKLGNSQDTYLRHKINVNLPNAGLKDCNVHFLKQSESLQKNQFSNLIQRKNQELKNIASEQPIFMASRSPPKNSGNVNSSDCDIKRKSVNGIFQYRYNHGGFKKQHKFISRQIDYRFEEPHGSASKQQWW